MRSRSPCLTARQQAYCQRRAKGSAPELAAIEAGYVSAYLASNRNEKLQIVRDEVARLKAMLPQKPVPTGCMPRDEATAILSDIARSPSSPAVCRVQAIKALAELEAWVATGPTVGIQINLGTVESKL